ncbi:MAG: diaminopimelate epimerase [Nocardiopsaceae bacterium]|nr:diaminopimelate epimerase [Nocardiopsaceae bacterium]
MTRILTTESAQHIAGHGRHFQLIVDVHLLLMRDGRVLLGRRANTGYGDGAYEPPSGRLGERETIVEAAVRAAAEEAGIALDPAGVTLAHVMHDVSGAGRIAFFLAADGWEGPVGGAAGGYSDLGWFPLDALPANMIDRARVAVRNFAAGTRFSTYPSFGLLSLDWLLMQLVKTHGSLNEIFALDAVPSAWASGAALREFVRAVCDRDSWTGGGDGIYLYDASSPRARAWFFNPDGSSAEFCGNGMRGLGRLIMDMRGTDAETVAVGDGSYAVRRAPSTPEGVSRVVLEHPALAFGDGELPPEFAGFTAVSVPNPHVIRVVDSYSEPELIAAGKRADEAFPEGANVSFLLAIAEGDVFVRTFERGAGLTPSCGSGMAASRAAYAKVTGTDPERPLLVRNVGGVAEVAMRIRDGQWFPVVSGNATVVYRAEAGMAGEQLGPVDYEPAENEAYAVLDERNTAALKSAGIVTAHP